MWMKKSIISVYIFCMQVPKQVPKTIESMREYDETMVAPGDEEVTCFVLSWNFVTFCLLPALVSFMLMSTWFSVSVEQCLPLFTLLCFSFCNYQGHILMKSKNVRIRLLEYVRWLLCFDKFQQYWQLHVHRCYWLCFTGGDWWICRWDGSLF